MHAGVLGTLVLRMQFLANHIMFVCLLALNWELSLTTREEEKGSRKRSEDFFNTRQPARLKESKMFILNFSILTR